MTLSRYIRALARGRPTYPPDAVEALLRSWLRDETSRRRLRRRPHALGLIEGGVGDWTPACDDELFLYAFEHVFVDGLESLVRALDRGDAAVCGLCRLRVRQFISQRQRAADRLGYAAFANACGALSLAVLRRRLVLEKGAPEVRRDSILRAPAETHETPLQAQLESPGTARYATAVARLATIAADRQAALADCLEDFDDLRRFTGLVFGETIKRDARQALTLSVDAETGSADDASAIGIMSLGDAFSATRVQVAVGRIEEAIDRLPPTPRRTRLARIWRLIHTRLTEGLPLLSQREFARVCEVSPATISADFRALLDIFLECGLNIPAAP